MKKLIAVCLFVFQFIGVVNAYEIIEPVETKEVASCWASSFPEFTETVGYSSLGHIFMRSPESKKYIVVHPFKSGAKNYGVFESVQDFEESILKESSFQALVLYLDHVEQIKAKLGELGKEEVYIPRPYPFLGGDESVDSYHKGNVWVMLDIVGQFHGLC